MQNFKQKLLNNMKEEEAHILEEKYKDSRTTKHPWKRDTFFKIFMLIFVLSMLLGILL